MRGTHWSFFIPSGPEVSVLLVGAGNGEVGCRLARRSCLVEALCFSETQVRAVAARARDAGLDNVVASLHRPDEALRFDDDRFDAVVIDRVLSYIPAAPMLSEARRVLAGGGVLYVGAENALYHALGLKALFETVRRSTPRPDPEFEADLAALGDGRRVERQGLGAYRGMLRAAGFRSVRVLAPLPDAARPQVVVTLDDYEPQRFLFRERVRRSDLRTRTVAAVGDLAAATGLLTRVVPFYYLVAGK